MWGGAGGETALAGDRAPEGGPGETGGLPLAGVAQGWVLLDVEPFDRLGVEVVVGAEPAGMDAVEGAEVVHLVDVAGDAERAHDLASAVADELAAGFQEQRPVGEFR